MAFDLTLFSNKLRRYRAQLDVSIEHLAAATGLPVEVISDLDAGARIPTGDEVLILADYFKCDYKFFISNEQLAPLEQTDKLFRKHGGDLTPADRWAIQEFLYLCECEAFLLDVLQRPAPRLFTFTKKGSYFKGHGEAAARELRRHLGFVENEIRGDMFAVFREIGVHIFRRRLENSRISGLYLKHPTAGKCVLVNYSEDVFRQRFTVAHEGGHSILDDEEDFVVSLSLKESDLVEVRANTFAAHFLLPPDSLQRLKPVTWDASTVVETATRLQVNVDTLLIALEREGLVTSADAATLRHLKVARQDKPDPELPPTLSRQARARKEALLERGLSTDYVRLCLEAHDRSLISASRVAEMLLVDEAGLADVADLFRWSPRHGS